MLDDERPSPKTRIVLFADLFVPFSADIRSVGNSLILMYTYREVVLR